MIEIIQEKLRQYRAANAVEEENATKEIIQEIALYALWRGDFFDVALFQGGTSLRSETYLSGGAASSCTKASSVATNALAAAER